MLRRRYIIWIGLCAILVPLLINLYTQYTSLTALQEASPLAQHAAWERRLNDVAESVQEYYLVRAREALDVPPSAIIPGSDDDNVEVYFKDAPHEGVKRYFISSPFARDQVKITLYDPETRRKVPERTPDHWAAFSASSAFLSMILRDASVDPDTLVFGEDDPENRIIARPITDSSSKIVGVAGMIVDVSYFKNVVLPERLPEALRTHLSESELDSVAITVVDDKGTLIASTHPKAGTTADVWVPLQMAFSRWRLGAKFEGLSQEELAGRSFAMNLSLIVLNTLVLIFGVGLALRAATKELKISQMKSDFVSNVSHELRTPLSSIRVLGEFLRSGREIDSDKLKKYGEYIETESQRLAKLINNILDFSKIESGQRTYHFEECMIEDVVAEALRVFEVRLQQRGFAIDLRAPSKVLPTVRIDPEAISQAIANLLDNAIKYSGSSRTIQVALGKQADYVTVSVTDYGIGIQKDELQKIFERFHRVSTGLVHDVKGTGLGLSLVKHIVEAHGGTVSVTSDIGKGSTFTLRLPIFKEAPQRDDAEQPRPFSGEKAPARAQ